MAATSNNAWPIPVSTDYVKNGYDAIDDLGNAIDTSVGAGLLAWQSYTPTLTGWGVGNGTWDARYCKIGKTVHVSMVFTDGSTTTETTNFIFSLPSGLPARSTLGFIGASSISSSVNATGVVTLLTTTTARVYVNDASTTYAKATNIATGVPGTWSAGDTVLCQITYETA